MGILRFFGKLIAFLFVLLLIVLLPATLWLYNLQRAVLDADTYTRLISNPSLYTEVIPGTLTGLIQGVHNDPTASPEERAMSGYLATLSSDDWDSILEALAPASWLQSEFDQNIQAVFDWLDGNDPIPSILFDMTPLKERLAGPEGEQVARTIVASWPMCSSEDAAANLAILNDEAAEDAVAAPCQLEGPDNIRLIQEVNDVVLTAAGAIPDNIPEQRTLTQPSPQQEMDILNVKLAIGITRRVAHLVFLIPLILFVLIELVAVRSFKSLFSWYGWPLVLGGLLSLVPIVALPFVWLTFFAADSVGGFRFFVTLMGVFTDFYGRPVLIQGGAVAASGLLFLIVASLIRSRDSREEQPA